MVEYMSYYLSDEEAKVSRTISNIASTLPEQVGVFAQYLEFEKHKSLGFIYERIKDIRLFYQVLSSELGMDIMDIKPEALSTITTDQINQYLAAPITPRGMNSKPASPSMTKRNKRKHSLWYYYDFLEMKKMVSANPIIQKPQMGKPKAKKIISSPDQVRFTGDAKIKTTIDGKYSIIKEKNPNQAESKYLYHIKDEIAESYITDVDGKVLSIIPYKNAREFVINLYTNGKKNDQ